MSFHPRLRALDLNLLVLFDALMTTRQLTAAARALGLTQSAASQALGRLRQSLDDELFVRARGGMRPTPLALALAPRVAEALAALDSAFEAGEHFDPATSERPFRIAFGITSELVRLPSILRAVARQGPAIQVLSQPGPAEQALAALERGELDFCLDHEVPRAARLESVCLGADAMIVLARRGHPRLEGRISRAAFFAERHVVLSIADERRAIVERRLERGRRRRRILAEVAHYASVPAIVRETDAIALVPRSLVERPGGHARDFLCLDPPFRVPALPVFLIWHASAAADAGHRWLRNAIEGAASGPAGAARG